MSDHSSNQPDLSSQFHGLNMSAQPFIPSAHAPVFQPGGNYQQMYGGGQYPMGGGAHQHVHGVYPGMPYHHPGYGGGMGGSGGYMHHGGMPYQHQNQQGRPPLHQMNPYSHGSQVGDRWGGGKNQQQQQQHHPYHHHQHNTTGGYNPSPQQPMTEKPKPTNLSNQKDSVPSSSKPTTSDEPPVDSWEDISVSDDSPPSKQTGPKPSVSSEAKVAASTGPSTSANTSSSQDPSPSNSSNNSASNVSSNGSSSSNVKPEKHFERKSKDTGNSGDSATTAVISSKVSKVLSQAPAPVKTEDEKENVNIVFIGHVDAGKSTIGGHLMYLTGQVDKRTLEKYEREAKEKNRETWYLSWALDTNQEERDKGKTVEVGRASFETEKKRFTILDAPGHAGFVPSMISGTVQADIGILVISARKGEFETGFERRGQTREHAMLAKTAGVKHLVVLVNKMDDPTVCWDESRYEEIKTKLTPFLKKVGFNPKSDIHYIPVSGLTGANLKVSASDACPWFKGSAFLPYLEELPPIAREDEGPLRIPIADKYKDMGTMVIGKVESGSVGKGSILIMMPNRTQVEVLSVIRVEEEAAAAFSGDNIKLKLKGIEEEDVSPGFVLCTPHSLCHTGKLFDAQVVILEYKSIICAGFSCVLHIHNVVEEVEIINLIARIDKKTGKKVPEKPKFIKQDHTAIARFQTSGIICMESFKDFPAMARFTLRDEGKTIAIGKVLKIIE